MHGALVYLAKTKGKPFDSSKQTYGEAWSRGVDLVNKSQWLLRLIKATTQHGDEIHILRHYTDQIYRRVLENATEADQ
jgi:hypothetical protein